MMKSTHRAEWKRYQEAVGNGQQRGGIMNGSGVSSNKSIFSSQASVEEGEEKSSISSDTLSMLEEGAASYDGSSVPMGEEVEGDTISFGSSQQSLAKANA